MACFPHIRLVQLSRQLVFACSIITQQNAQVSQRNIFSIIPQLFKTLGDVGLLGLNKPTKCVYEFCMIPVEMGGFIGRICSRYGGSGLDFSFNVLLAEEVCKYCR